MNLNPVIQQQGNWNQPHSLPVFIENFWQAWRSCIKRGTMWLNINDGKSPRIWLWIEAQIQPEVALWERYIGRIEAKRIRISVGFVGVRVNEVSLSEIHCLSNQKLASSSFRSTSSSAIGHWIGCADLLHSHGQFIEIGQGSFNMYSMLTANPRKLGHACGEFPGHRIKPPPT